MTYTLDDSDHGFVVRYINDNGVVIWSEWYETLADVQIAYPGHFD
jgi:hypothetical protein